MLSIYCFLWSPTSVNSLRYSFPLEMHIVCQNTRYTNLSSAVAHEDGLAVLGVMFEARTSTAYRL